MSDLKGMYNEDIVAKFASLSEFFYEFLEIEYGEDFELSEAESRRILQAAMGELGHENLDMEKLNQSYRYYLYEVDLHANSAYEIDCPEFEKYLLVN